MTCNFGPDGQRDDFITLVQMSNKNTDAPFHFGPDGCYSPGGSGQEFELEFEINSVDVFCHVLKVL